MNTAFRWFAPLSIGLALPMSAAQAQTITLVEGNYDNLSMYDCVSNGSTQVSFSYAYPWMNGEAAEYFLSLDPACLPPPGGPIVESSTPGTSPTSAMIDVLNPLPQPSDGMTTDSDATTNLTFAGIWDYWLAANAASDGGTAPVQYNAAPPSESCAPGLQNATVYLCVLIQVPGDDPPALAAANVGFSLTSQLPPAPPAPTVTASGDALFVEWSDVTSATYYSAHAFLMPDGGLADGTGADGGPPLPSDVSRVEVAEQTNARILNLEDGVLYGVYVQALDGAGTNPPTTSNVSAPSPISTGTPVGPTGTRTAPRGCSCSGSSGASPLALLLAWWRRCRKRPPPWDLHGTSTYRRTFARIASSSVCVICGLMGTRR